MSTDASGVVAAGAKAAPPLSITGLSLAGVPLSDWLVLLTIIYTLLQIVKVVLEIKARRSRKHDRSPAVLADRE